jgi:hypothetical protein
MPRIQDTAYPRLKSVLTAHDLNTAFTPTPDELLLARRLTKGPAAQLGFLVLLKLYQRLGRAMPLAETPRPIIDHIARIAVLPSAALVPDAYDHSGTQQRHLAAIRQHLRVQPSGAAARHAMIAALAEAAATKYERCDQCHERYLGSLSRRRSNQYIGDAPPVEVALLPVVKREQAHQARGRPQGWSCIGSRQLEHARTGCPGSHVTRTSTSPS